jgi:hypothetical protein
MKIINIEAHGDGFKGLFTEDYQRYHRFNISPTKFQVIPLRTPSDISSYDRFIDTWKKYGNRAQFLNSPIEIEELTFDTLKKLKAASGPDLSLSR